MLLPHLQHACVLLQLLRRIFNLRLLLLRLLLLRLLMLLLRRTILGLHHVSRLRCLERPAIPIHAPVLSPSTNTSPIRRGRRAVCRGWLLQGLMRQAGVEQRAGPSSIIAGGVVVSVGLSTIRLIAIGFLAIGSLPIGFIAVAWAGAGDVWFGALVVHWTVRLRKLPGLGPRPGPAPSCRKDQSASVKELHVTVVAQQRDCHTQKPS